MTTAQKGEANAAKGAVPPPPAFSSKLPEGWQRFLAHVIEHGFEVSRRTPEDFIRHFPPAAIMNGLKEEPELRANIMVIATGVRAKIALKKSHESCSHDLQIALDEEETDAETVVTLFDPDDRVRFLNQQALWTYVTEGDFWNADRVKDAGGHRRSADHLAYLLDRALADGLLTHRDVIEGIKTETIAEMLPREELSKIILGALAAGHKNRPFSERDLLAMTPMSTLVQHIPLSLLWRQVVVPKIAQPHGFVPKPVPKPPAEAAATEDAIVKVEDKNKDVKKEEKDKEKEKDKEADMLASTGLDMEIDDVLDTFDKSVSTKPEKKGNRKSAPPS